MDGLLQIAVIVGMFILRLGVPLLITLLVAYWLRRLDGKWEAQARARQQTEPTPAEKPQSAAPKPTVLGTKHS
jgi:hypothetical protein